MIDFEDDLDFSQSFDQQILADYQSQSSKTVAAVGGVTNTRDQCTPSLIRSDVGARSRITPATTIRSSLVCLSPPVASVAQRGSGHTRGDLGHVSVPGTPESAMVSQLFRRPPNSNAMSKRGVSINNNSFDDDVDDLELSAMLETEDKLSPQFPVVSPIFFPSKSAPFSGNVSGTIAGNVSPSPAVVPARHDRSDESTLATPTGSGCHQLESLSNCDNMTAFGLDCAISPCANRFDTGSSRGEGDSPMFHVKEVEEKEGRDGDRCARRFPGPAGVLPIKGASLAFIHEVVLDQSDDDSDTGEYSALADTSTQMEFHDGSDINGVGEPNLTNSDIWQRAIDELGASTTNRDAISCLLRRFNIGRLAAVCALRRVRHVPLMVVAVRHLQPVTQLSWRAVFVDATGVMRGCITSSSVHATSIRVGSVLVLRHPAVWRSSPRAHYISVTQRSLAMVLTPKGGTSANQRSFCDLSSSSIKDSVPDDVTVTRLLPVECDRLLTASMEGDEWPSAVLAEDTPNPIPIHTTSVSKPSNSRSTPVSGPRSSARSWKRPRYGSGGRGRGYPISNGTHSNTTRGAPGTPLSRTTTVPHHLPPPEKMNSDLDAIFAEEADDTLFSDI